MDAADRGMGAQWHGPARVVNRAGFSGDRFV